MKKIFLLCSGILLVSNIALAEVPTKPSYSNTVKTIGEKKSEEKKEIEVATDEANKETSRAMLAEKSDKDAKKNHVLNNMKSGRLAESNKQLIK